jgi:hypothetical protein
MAARALVLGGGGWSGSHGSRDCSLGLSESGVDLAQAHFIVGTSAASFVGA